jgi:hypothetical protein
MIFAREDDAQRVMDVLPKRMTRYGLTVHPEKTRLVDFRDPQRTHPDRNPKTDGEPKSDTFDFLGFTHRWGRSRRGFRIVTRKTSKSRLNRALRSIWAWCREHRHDPLIAQFTTLSQKLQGHYAYYGVTGNYRSLRGFWQGVKRSWRYWLGRRRRDGAMSWDEFDRLAVRYPLPEARIVHRFTAS